MSEINLKFKEIVEMLDGAGSSDAAVFTIPMKIVKLLDKYPEQEDVIIFELLYHFKQLILSEIQRPETE